MSYRTHAGLVVAIRLSLAALVALLLCGCGPSKPAASGPPALPASGASQPPPPPPPPPVAERTPDPDDEDGRAHSTKHAKRSAPGGKPAEKGELRPPSPLLPPDAGSIGAAVGKDSHPVAAKPSPPMPAFEWPPPHPSEEYVLPHSVFGDGSRAISFSDVDRILGAALDTGGYEARNYYSVPNGFALATRIEQINEDGTPKLPPARFALEPEAVSVLRPMDYLRALLKGVPGYYRVIVFIVTDTPFQASGARPSEARATAWVSSGQNVLDDDVGHQVFTSKTNCTALVYEFLRKPGADSDATEFATPGHLDAMTHLVKSGIWRGFGAH